MEGNETEETPSESLPTGKRLNGHPVSLTPDQYERLRALPAGKRLKGQPVWVKLDQYERLRALAAKDGNSLAAHARRAVEAYLRKEEKRGSTLEVRA